MTTRTRCKVNCSSVADFGFSKKVTLNPVYAPNEDGSSEDAGFTKATPSGEFWMTIDNPAAAVQFVPGRKYYVDFSPAD